MASELTGKLLNRYELQGRLGRGGMGDVYRGLDTTLDRTIAIKVLHPHLADEAGFRERFEREAKTMAALKHPNIVQVYDFGFDQEQGVYCLVMEFLPSMTLEARMMELRDKPLEQRLEAVKLLFGPLVSAVDYAHQRGMVHRDIKPGNVLINERGEPVLADFGLARLISAERLTISGAATGTPAYMSPEQGMGQGGDGRSDIYSLGIILYEMIAGMTPYSADTPFGLIMAHVNDPLPELSAKVPNVPSMLESVLLRALAKRPDDRYQTAGEMWADLVAVLEGKEVTIKTPPVPSNRTTVIMAIQQQVKQRPYLLWGTLAALVIIFAIALYTANRQDNPGSGDGGEIPSMASKDETEIPSMASGGEGDIPSMAGPTEIFDDFSDPDSGWQTRQSDSVSYGYEDGAFHFVVRVGGQAQFAMFDPHYTFSALYMEVTGTLLDGQPESGYGVVFRWQDMGNFYVFAVNGLGQVSVWTFEGGTTWTELRGLGEFWTDSDAVNPAGESNTLTLIADGSHIVGMVNQEIVVDLTDDTFEDGAVGFYVDTTLARVENPLADILFDDFSAQPSIPAMTP